jgi:hypothetical protein
VVSKIPPIQPNVRYFVPTVFFSFLFMKESNNKLKKKRIGEVQNKHFRENKRERENGATINK